MTSFLYSRLRSMDARLSDWNVGMYTCTPPSNVGELCLAPPRKKINNSPSRNMTTSGHCRVFSTKSLTICNFLFRDMMSNQNQIFQSSYSSSVSSFTTSSGRSTPSSLTPPTTYHPPSTTYHPQPLIRLKRNNPPVKSATKHISVPNNKARPWSVESR